MDLWKDELAGMFSGATWRKIMTVDIHYAGEFLLFRGDNSDIHIYFLEQQKLVVADFCIYLTI